MTLCLMSRLVTAIEPVRLPVASLREYLGHDTALYLQVVVDVCDREGARIFDSGRLASGYGYCPPVAGNQQLIRTTVGIPARL